MPLDLCFSHTNCTFKPFRIFLRSRKPLMLSTWSKQARIFAKLSKGCFAVIMRCARLTLGTSQPASMGPV